MAALRNRKSEGRLDSKLLFYQFALDGGMNWENFYDIVNPLSVPLQPSGIEKPGDPVTKFFRLYVIGIAAEGCVTPRGVA